MNTIFTHAKLPRLGVLAALTMMMVAIACTTSPDTQSQTSAGEAAPAVKMPPPAPSKQHIKYPFAYREDVQPIVAAHRGGGDIAGYPENCLESIQYLAQTSGMWVEVDIRETKDGRLVLLHDVSMERTSDCAGRIEAMTYDEISKCRLKDNFGTSTDYRPPLLEDLLNWNAKTRATVIPLDIKQNVDYDDVIRLVRKHDQMEHVYFIAYTIGQAKALRRKAPEAVISVTIRNEEELERFLDSGLSTDKMMAFTGTIRSPKALYDRLHDLGMMTVFGTMGNIDRQAERRGRSVYEALYADGVDIISTDRPLRVWE